MSVITLINGVPLFTTSKQATDWGARYNIQGFHTHTFEGKVGYMSGDNHEQIVLASQTDVLPEEIQENFNVVQEEPVEEIQTTTTTTTTTTTYSSGGGGY